MKNFSLSKPNLFRCLKDNGDFSKGGYGFLTAHEIIIINSNDKAEELVARRFIRKGIPSRGRNTFSVRLSQEA